MTVPFVASLHLSCAQALAFVADSIGPAKTILLLGADSLLAVMIYWDLFKQHGKE